MARIRSIKPSFWVSEQVVECSPMARLLFIGLWNFCDDHGRHPNSPKQIKAELFPADDISLDDIQGWIDELSSNGLLLTYDVDAKALLQVTGWHHQKIDKPQPAKYPPPENSIKTGADNSANDRRTVAPDRIGKDRKGEDARAIALRKELVAIYDKANHLPPDMGRCEVWIAQGYDPRIIAPLIAERIKPGSPSKPLSYFEKPIAEAHAVKANVSAEEVNQEALERTYSALLDSEARTGEWRSRRIAKSDIPPEFIQKWQEARA